jgi:hypothetical protein
MDPYRRVVHQHGIAFLAGVGKKAPNILAIPTTANIQLVINKAHSRTMKTDEQAFAFLQPK